MNATDVQPNPAAAQDHQEDWRRRGIGQRNRASKLRKPRFVLWFLSFIQSSDDSGFRAFPILIGFLGVVSGVSSLSNSSRSLRSLARRSFWRVDFSRASLLASPARASSPPTALRNSRCSFSTSSIISVNSAARFLASAREGFPNLGRPSMSLARCSPTSGTSVNELSVKSFKSISPGSSASVTAASNSATGTAPPEPAVRGIRMKLSQLDALSHQPPLNFNLDGTRNRHSRFIFQRPTQLRATGGGFPSSCPAGGEGFLTGDPRLPTPAATGCRDAAGLGTTISHPQLLHRARCPTRSSGAEWRTEHPVHLKLIIGYSRQKSVRKSRRISLTLRPPRNKFLKVYGCDFHQIHNAHGTASVPRAAGKDDAFGSTEEYRGLSLLLVRCCRVAIIRRAEQHVLPRSPDRRQARPGPRRRLATTSWDWLTHLEQIDAITSRLDCGMIR